MSSYLRVFAASCVAAGIAVGASARQALPLKSGMVITQSITIRPGTYRIAADPAITIRGNNITVDFNGAVLDGGAPGADPDAFAGTGILIDGGSHVTLKNAVVRGYKVGIQARTSPDLHLTRNDVSYNWKQRLYSGIEKESLLDWMSYHQNEKDEWLRFGAGIYLRNCDRAEIDHNTAVQGQNGLMVTDSSHLKIWNNTFQFLSSIGVGLYRVTHSTIMHNRIDWCVRGYSHGFYNRGQDSAGLLMYEQSSNNTVAHNSVTHGGDGLFLWAGQTTMDTGKGGANDNLFAGNDFSHAPTNGIEATFSRNTFIGNRVEENWHGVWGGYSFESKWIGNRFSRNTEAMAIEHGQDNVIQANTFDGDGTAIRLWQNATQDPNWGYPKNRDTRSRGYRIAQNQFRGNKVAFDVRNTADVIVEENTFHDVGTALSPQTTGIVLGKPSPIVSVVDRGELPPALPGGLEAMIKEGERRGRDTIIVDEWGPYDWKSPLLTPVLKAPELRGRAYQPLRVLGPPGTWKLVSARGVSVSPLTGKVGDVLTLSPLPQTSGRLKPAPTTDAGLKPAATTDAPYVGAGFSRPDLADYEIVLEYRGAAVTSPRGEKTKAGAPYQFRYSYFFAPIDWTIEFFPYTDATDPVKQPAAFAKLLEGDGVTLKTDRIQYLSGGVIEDGIPRDRFAFTARGSVDLPDGEYLLRIISDDGARVWVDGAVIVDEWDPHESRVASARIRGGKHDVRVDYYEISGWVEMKFDLQPRRTRK